MALLMAAAAAEAADEEQARDVIVVTAQKTIQGGQVAAESRVGILGNSDVYSTPFNVKGFTAELIRDQGARSINDIVANDPSVRVSLSPTFVLDQSSIRGFLVAGGNYLIDGLPGLSPNYGTVPVAHFERIDIFKGPTSALTAAVGAVGGNINLIPKRATDRRVASFTASAQSDVLFGGHVDLGGRFGADNMFGVRVNVSSEAGTLYDGGDRDQTAVTLALDLRKGPFRAIFDAGYTEFTSRGAGINFSLAPGAVLPRVPDPSTARSPQWSYFNDRSWYALGTVELDLAETVTAYVRYGNSGQRMDSVGFATTPLDSAGGYGVTGVSYRPWNNRETVAELGIRGTLVTGPLTHRLVATGLRQTGGATAFGTFANTNIAGLPRGSIYTRYPITDSPFAGGLPPRTIVPAQQPVLSSVAVADDISAFDDRLRIILSARRQRIEQAPYDQSRTTPTLALLFKPLDKLSLYANYAETLSQGAIAPSDGTVDNPGEQLPPYVSRQYEIGAKFNAGRFGVTVAAFDIRQDFAVTIGRRFIVGGQQRNRGIELETFGEPLPGLRVLGGAAYIDGYQARTATGATTGKKALGVPEWTVNLGLEHDLRAVPGLTITGRYLFTDKSFIDLANAQVVPAWGRFDTSARYKFTVNGATLTARAGITNLFDKAYWTTGGRNLVVVAPPRTWFASVSADF